MKPAHLTDAITEALEQRAAPPGLASLAAACGAAVPTRARLQWLAGWPSGYAALLTDAFAELGLLVTVRGEQGHEQGQPSRW